MKVLKVIVDELPSTCHSCSLFIMTQYEGYDFCPFSALSNEDIRVDYYDKLAKKNKRPDWCPLILEEDVETWLMTRPQKPKYVLCDNNTRPIEDALRAELARLQEKLHDEMSQLEIATDLGNKRWVALNDIYENGEKHNANWCKRKAQEGLGIK